LGEGRALKKIAQPLYMTAQKSYSYTVSQRYYQLEHLLAPRQLRLYLKVVRFLVNPPVPTPINCGCADYLEK